MPVQKKSGNLLNAPRKSIFLMPRTKSDIASFTFLAGSRFRIITAKLKWQVRGWSEHGLSFCIVFFNHLKIKIHN